MNEDDPNQPNNPNPENPPAAEQAPKSNWDIAADAVDKYGKTALDMAKAAGLAGVPYLQGPPTGLTSGDAAKMAAHAIRSMPYDIMNAQYMAGQAAEAVGEKADQVGQAVMDKVSDVAANPANVEKAIQESNEKIPSGDHMFGNPEAEAAALKEKDAAQAKADEKASTELKADEAKIQSETDLAQKHSDETAALVKEAKEKADSMGPKSSIEQQQAEFQKQADNLNSAFQRQDGERAALYENNTATTQLGQNLQNDNRETIAEECHAQRMEGTRDVCQAFAEKSPIIANDAKNFQEVLQDRTGMTQDQKNAKVNEFKADQVGQEAAQLHKGTFDGVSNEMKPGFPLGPPKAEPAPEPAAPAPAAPAPQQPAPSISPSL